MSYRAREIVEAPTGIEPAASWIEARRSVQMSYGARDVMVGLDGVEPRHTGALPLSYRPLGSVGCHAKTRTWTTELTAPDATVTSRGSGGESDSDPRAGSRRPTWIAAGSLPDKLPFSRRWPPANGRSLLGG